MKVTLDIFSGRPNPSWILRPDAEKEVARRLQGLPRTCQVLGEDDLGYRGFVISQPGENGLQEEIRVCAGVVTSKGQTGVSTFCDTNNLEKWLAEQAREQGHEGLLATVSGLLPD